MDPRTVDLRRNKRYQLKARVVFVWESTDGQKCGEGYTRDLSSFGVYVVAANRLPMEIMIKIEVNLPSLHEKHFGISLQTQGRVVRSEEGGFAVAADMGFRIQFPNSKTSKQIVDASGKQGNVMHNLRRGQCSAGQGNNLISRFAV